MRKSFIGQMAMVTLLLISLVGSVNAADCGGGTPCNCGDTVVAEYTLTADLECSSTTGAGLIIGANDITLDGAGYKITGNADVGVCLDSQEYNPASHCGIRNNGNYDNVVIKNLEIENFCTGIALGDGLHTDVDSNTVTGCRIHDNGNNIDGTSTHGIHMVGANNCIITKNEIYNNKGTGDGCGDGGNGIFLQACSTSRGNYNNIIHNKFYDNRKSGFFMKMKPRYNNISHNNATGNGEGGIVLMCMLSNENVIEYNNASGNAESGIFIGGKLNIIRHNIANNNGYAGINMGRSSESNNNELCENEVCGNEDIDIKVASECTGNHGNDNTCDTTKNYNDDGITGCANSCSGSATTTSSSTTSTTTTSLAATTTTMSTGTSTTTTSIQGPTSSTTTIGTGTTITASTIAAPSQFVTVSSPSKVAPPEGFKVEVKLSGKKVLGASFNLLFNPEVVKAIKVEEGAFYKNCPGTTFSAVPAEIDNAAGEIKFQDMCLGSTMSGEGVVATIRFSVKSLGDPEINLENVQLFDEKGDLMDENKIEVKNAEMQVINVVTTTSTPTSIPSSTTSVPTTNMTTREHTTKTAESNPQGIVGQVVGFSIDNGSWIPGILIVMGLVFYVGYSRGNNNRGSNGGRIGGVSLGKQS